MAARIWDGNKGYEDRIGWDMNDVDRVKDKSGWDSVGTRGAAKCSRSEYRQIIYFTMSLCIIYCLLTSKTQTISAVWSV